MSRKANTKKQIVTDTKNQEVIAKASNIQADKALNSLSSLGLEIQRVLGTVSSNFVEKLAELEAVEQSIELKKKEMEDLHGADAILMSIDELRVQHQKTLQEFTLEIDKANEDRDKLEEEEEQLRKREDEEYEYHLQKARKVKEDAWQEQLRIRHRDELIRQEEFNKAITARTEELIKQETQYKAALEKAENFDAEVKKATEKDVAILTNVLKKDHAHSIQLTDIQHKSEIENLKAKLTSTELALTQRDATIAELRAQLKQAQESQIQLAKDAVNAANQKSAQADAMAMLTSIGANGTRPART